MYLNGSLFYIVVYITCVYLSCIHRNVMKIDVIIKS